MRRKRLLVCAFAFVAALVATTAQADRRVALVIGNSAYRNTAPLPNTINDANAIAALFRSVGFEVVSSRTELGVLEFKRAVRDFLITAETADIAVVYYAGHGIEVAGSNYLIPVDAKLARDYDVEDEAVALDRIIWALQPVKRLRLILLDACRDNPFAARLQRSVGIRATPKGGLAKIDDVSADTLIAYAAKEGSVSYDGAGANSPFASALLKHLTEPGLDIRIALGRVRDDVLKTTAGRQEPFIYGSLGGSIIPLVPQGKAIEPKPIPAPAVAVREPPPLRPNAAAALTPAVPSARAEPSESLQSKLQAALEKEDSASACSRDEQRLARLRSDPVPEEIARFQRELGCVRLKAQVQRLYESVLAEQPASSAALGGGPAKPAGRAEPSPEGGPRQQAQAPPVEPQNVCARDAERLGRLRAEPTLDAITRFDRELGCEQIRPQLRRLRESVGQ
jgi:Caspase domain